MERCLTVHTSHIVHLLLCCIHLILNEGTKVCKDNSKSFFKMRYLPGRCPASGTQTVDRKDLLERQKCSIAFAIAVGSSPSKSCFFPVPSMDCSSSRLRPCRASSDLHCHNPIHRSTCSFARCQSVLVLFASHQSDRLQIVESCCCYYCLVTSTAMFR